MVEDNLSSDTMSEHFREFLYSLPYLTTPSLSFTDAGVHDVDFLRDGQERIGN